MRTTEEENMDYVYNYNDMQFFIETKNNIEEKMHRRLTYYKMYIYPYIIGELREEKKKDHHQILGKQGAKCKA